MALIHSHWINTWLNAILYTLTINKNCTTYNKGVLIWFTYFKQVSLIYYNLLKFTPDLLRKYKEHWAEKNSLMLKQFHAPPYWHWDGSRRQDSCLFTRWNQWSEIMICYIAWNTHTHTCTHLYKYAQSELHYSLRLIVLF